MIVTVSIKLNSREGKTYDVEEQIVVIAPGKPQGNYLQFGYLLWHCSQSGVSYVGTSVVSLCIERDSFSRRLRIPSIGVAEE